MANPNESPDLNPYASPRAIPENLPDPSALAQQRLGRPATALIIMASIHSVLVAIQLVSMVVAGEGRVVIVNLLPFILACLQLTALITIAIGAAKMAFLESFIMGRVAAVLACIPVISPFLILGIPFGIWASRLLAEPEIQSAFVARRNLDPK